MFGEHSLVDDPYDKNSVGVFAVEDDVASRLDATQTLSYFVGGASYRRTVCDLPAGGFELGKITIKLIYAPPLQRESTDLHEILFGSARQTKSTQA
jgi:hypothetical protein